jgi:hypothetical protein
VQLGIGGTSGMVTDDSETFRLDNLESGASGVVLHVRSVITCVVVDNTLGNLCSFLFFWLF